MGSSFAYTKTDSILKVDNVSLSLDGKQILRNINFDIKEINRNDSIAGEVIGVLAPSGMGKTQLMNCLCGYYNPVDNNDPDDYTYMTGNVLIGKDQKQVQLGQVGLVQQNYPIWKHRTVNSILMKAAHKLHNGERKDKVETYLNHFNLMDKRELYPSQLSGGQKQRIGLAAAFINADNIVLLDEVTSGLDPIMTDKVLELIVSTANLNKDNVIVMVSHDVTNTLAVANSVIMLGKEKNLDGTTIPGATIKYSYDLIDLDFAWHPDIRNNPRFLEFAQEVRDNFKNLI